MTSAAMPGASLPVSGRFIAAAPPDVAISRISWVVRNSGSLVLALWISPANFISWNMSRALWLAGPSVASPTVIPASRTARSGMVPETSLALQTGQWPIRVPVAASALMSPASSWLQWAAVTSGPRKPIELEPLRRPLAVRLEAVVDLLHALGEVGVDRHPGRVGDLAHQPEHVLAAGIDRMRRQRDLDPPVAGIVILRDLVAEGLQRLPRPVGDRRVDAAVGEAVAERRPERQHLQRLDLGLDAVGVEVLVEGGDARTSPSRSGR